MRKDIKMYVTSGLMVLMALAILSFIKIESPTLAFTLVDIAPEGFEFEVPLDASPEAALKSLELAEIEIEEVKKANLNTAFMEDVLLEARGFYQEKVYLSVFESTQLISYLKEKQIELSDKTELIIRKEEELRKNGVKTEAALALIEQAKEALQKEQLADTDFLLAQADEALEEARIEHFRVRDLVRLSKNFFIKYWWQILTIVIIIGVSTPPLVKRIKKQRIKKKMGRFKAELQKTEGLIKDLQRKCFVEGKITTKTYKTKAAKYEERRNEIKHTLPVLEAQLTGEKVKKEEKTKGVLEVKR